MNAPLLDRPLFASRTVLGWRTRTKLRTAYGITLNYREAYGVRTRDRILLNHESPLRGETFVTCEITRAMTRFARGLQVWDWFQRTFRLRSLTSWCVLPISRLWLASNDPPMRDVSRSKRFG